MYKIRKQVLEGSHGIKDLVEGIASGNDFLKIFENRPSLKGLQ